MEIRPARSGDAPRMGEVHVKAWQGAYRGLMPDAYLDGLDPADRTAMWRHALADPMPRTHLDVVLDDAGTLVGFAASGPDRDRAPDTGELYAINLDPVSWGQGLGGALIRHIVEQLVADGHGTAVLWVVTGNERARAIYERLGWSADGAERTDDVLGVRVQELRYRTPLRP